MMMSTSLLHHSKVKIVTNYIRYTRIVKHSVMHVLTGNIAHEYEVYHYKHMKKFTNIN